MYAFLLMTAKKKYNWKSIISVFLIIFVWFYFALNYQRRIKSSQIIPLRVRTVADTKTLLSYTIPTWLAYKHCVVLLFPIHILNIQNYSKFLFIQRGIHKILIKSDASRYLFIYFFAHINFRSTYSITWRKNCKKYNLFWRTQIKGYFP